jgi:hypothetical protein
MIYSALPTTTLAQSALRFSRPVPRSGGGVEHLPLERGVMVAWSYHPLQRLHPDHYNHLAPNILQWSDSVMVPLQASYDYAAVLSPTFALIEISERQGTCLGRSFFSFL